MIELLENRLGLDEDIVDGVENALRHPHINPREHWQEMPYLKSELAVEVGEGIGSVDFWKNIYSAVNKDVLKRVYYGILSTGQLPKQFLKALTDWERVYFFRGRWSERNPKLGMPIEVLTLEHIHLGLNKLHEDHYVRKARGQYVSKKKFPEADRIREDYKRITSQGF